MTRALFVALVVFVLGPSTSPVAAQPTIDEFLCEMRSSTLLWTFVRAKAGCVRECQRDLRAGNVADPAECQPPYDIGATHGCINGTEGKIGGKFCKYCNPDMPECYGTDTCENTADGLVATFEGEADALLAEIYCDESGDPNGLNALEGRCEDTVAASATKAAAYYARCLAKCCSGAFKGAYDASACTPGAVTDERTLGCISKIQLKYPLYIDRRCTGDDGDAPECHNGRTGADWVARVESDVNEHYADFFCEP
jgi:hypothetical protein